VAAAVLDIPSAELYTLYGLATENRNQTRFEAMSDFCAYLKRCSGKNHSMSKIVRRLRYEMTESALRSGFEHIQMSFPEKKTAMRDELAGKRTRKNKKLRMSALTHTSEPPTSPSHDADVRKVPQFAPPRCEWETPEGALVGILASTPKGKN
jgi:hypothetical protein